MILVVDVDYKNTIANAAALVFKKFSDESPLSSYTKIIKNIAEYKSGEFFRRELPCILEILKVVNEKIDLIVVDGYVWLNSNQKPGLGAHLFEALENKTPIIGVAKRSFHGKNDKMSKIIRGESTNPLYITSVGIELKTAANYIAQMHGIYRIPTLLKKVDQLCRNW